VLKVSRPGFDSLADYVKRKKYFGFRGSAPDPNRGAYTALPDPFAEISNFFEMITEMLRVKQF